MPIRENYTVTKIYSTISSPLIIGTVSSTAFNFDNGFGLAGDPTTRSVVETGADDGITFGFSVFNASGTITFDILQSETLSGAYTSIPSKNRVEQVVLQTILSTVPTGSNMIRVGIIGATGPYYKVTATSGVAIGTVWGVVEVSTFEQPIRLIEHPP